MDLLAKENREFSCGLSRLIPGYVVVVECDLSGVQLKEAELDENIIRQDITWQERAAALAEIHSLRRAANPSQTFSDTAKEVAAKGGGGSAPTADYLRTAVREAVLVAEHLDNPTIANARNFREAHALILKREEELVTAELAKRRLALMPTTPDLEVRNADLEEILPRLETDQFDLIVADPPYGIDASGGGFRARTVHHHNYVDDESTARRVAQAILTEGFRLTKFRSNIFLFTDIKHWEWLQRISAQIGWTPFRRPLIWGKSDSEGLAPWGAQGPRITTEFIFFATKGQKGLLASPVDYLRVNRVPRHERIHAAEKPVELIRKLLECSTLPGDRVLDPCCGSGSTLVACRELNRRALGIEKDLDYFNTAMANVHGGKRP
jgi:site-specific DNA-methyltransferase (adenine-specific)